MEVPEGRRKGEENVKKWVQHLCKYTEQLGELQEGSVQASKMAHLVCACYKLQSTQWKERMGF